MNGMRVELLFLRWLLIIAVIALAVIYARSSRPDKAAVQYETIPLIQGGRSSGMPLVGIAVDPDRRDIYAVVGGPSAKEKGKEQPFFIVWKKKEGSTYGTTFTRPTEGAEALCEITPEGESRVLHWFGNEPKDSLATNDGKETVSAANALRSIMQALPPDSVMRDK